MPNLYDDDVTSLGYSQGVPCKRRTEASPDLCEKWTRATGLWAVPVKEASSSESGNVECGFNDWKRKGVVGSDREDVGGCAVCLQETRWKGNKARELGGDCKLLYSGADERGRNGVGIVLSKEFKDSLINCECEQNKRSSDECQVRHRRDCGQRYLCRRSPSGL